MSKEHWKIPFEFVPMPLECGKASPPLSLPEWKMAHYLLKQIRFGEAIKPLSDDELLNGTLDKNGKREDSGCGLSRNGMKQARKSLAERGWISVENVSVDASRPKHIHTVLLSNERQKPGVAPRQQVSQDDTGAGRQEVSPGDSAVSQDEKPGVAPRQQVSQDDTLNKEDRKIISTLDKKTPSGEPGEPAVSEPEEADPRFQPTVDSIKACWPKESKFHFDQADGAALNRFLRKGKGKNLDLDSIQELIAMRFCSDHDGVNLTESIRTWIGKLNEYESGPRNKFGKPKFSGDNLVQLRQRALETLKRRLAQPLATQQSLPDPPVIKVPPDFQASAGELLWSSILEVAIRQNRNGIDLRKTKGLGIWKRSLFVRVPALEFRTKLEKMKTILDQEIDGTPVDAIRFLTAKEFDNYPWEVGE